MKINKRKWKVFPLVASILLLCLGFGLMEEVQAKEITGASSSQMKIILQTVYLDGEISEEIVVQEDDFDVIHQNYRDWELVALSEKKIVLRKQVDDISPLLKVNGYFGLTMDGSLSIFNGEPKDRNVIQSFYQIDIEKLESRKQQELKKGIPVRTKDEFMEVLEAFKPYMVTVQN